MMSSPPPPLKADAKVTQRPKESKPHSKKRKAEVTLDEIVDTEASAAMRAKLRSHHNEPSIAADLPAPRQDNTPRAVPKPARSKTASPQNIGRHSMSGIMEVGGDYSSHPQNLLGTVLRSANSSVVALKSSADSSLSIMTGLKTAMQSLHSSGSNMELKAVERNIDILTQIQVLVETLTAIEK
jgi:hypothetical protein